jgi:maleylacetate reductase
MAEADIARIVELATANPYGNPRDITAVGMERLLREAWTGEPPGDRGTS